jgi:sugar lactone lactonase YvrE
MAWDGKNIWVSSWYDGRIYKMDPDTMDILGYITSPVKKTTGIAFEGAFLWVTGTYSDLYKMELQN